VRCALQPDYTLRPTAAQLLASDPYIKDGPECVVAAAAVQRERQWAEDWKAVHEIRGYNRKEQQHCNVLLDS
jgi:hypothetical protein